MVKLQLKDNRTIVLRSLTPNDKNKLLNMFSTMSDEALQWSMAPYTIETIERWINNLSNSISFVAEWDSKIVGYTSIFKSPHPRRQKVGSLLIYLHQDFHNVGLGTIMMNKLLQIAQSEDMHKINLSVVEENKWAIQLYKKFGFVNEGISRESFFGHDRKYHNLIHMGLIF